MAIGTSYYLLRIRQKPDIGKPLGNSQIQPIMSHLQRHVTTLFHQKLCDKISTFLTLLTSITDRHSKIKHSQTIQNEAMQRCRYTY